MTDAMLHGVLCMPPDLWDDTELDKMQRYSRYVEASRRIEEDEREIAALREKIAQLELGEYICKQCGLRKDSDYPKGDF